MKTTTFFLLFFLLLPSSYAAVGIVLPPVEEREFFFSPEEEYSWAWSIHRSNNMITWLSGDLAEYATLDDPNQGGGPRTVRFSLSLPDDLEPGLHRLQLNAQEQIEESAGVQARAAVGGQIRIISLYPDPWVQVRMKTKDAPENSSTHVDFDILSFSEVPTTVYADIKVLDLNGNELLSTRSDTATIESQQRRNLRVALATQDFEPGSYTVKAKIIGSAEDIELEGIFRIGTLEVYLGKYTRVVPTKSVNKIEVELISRWTNRIDGVYADITLLGVTERTPTIGLNPIDGGKVSTFFDMREVVNDTMAEGSVRIYYAEGGSSTYPITVNITSELNPRDERPASFFQLNTLTMTYLVLIVLVIINVVLLLRRKK